MITKRQLSLNEEFVLIDKNIYKICRNPGIIGLWLICLSISSKIEINRILFYLFFSAG